MLQEFIANAVTLYWKDTMNVQIVVVISAICVRLQLCHFHCIFCEGSQVFSIRIVVVSYIL